MSEETGFSFYSGMLSVGSCIGYLLTGSDKLTFEVDRVGVGDVCFFLTMRCFNDAMFSNS